MRAFKMDIVIPEDRQVKLSLPDDLPTGPAEVIVLVPAKSVDRRGGMGMDVGKGRVRDDFNDPLPENV